MTYSKVNPSELTIDVCERSISTLSTKVKSLLKTDKIWVPDEAQSFPIFEAEGPQKVLLLGGFLNRILESGNWPTGDYEFWSCSSSLNKVMTQIIGFDQQEIGLIDRYELFPSAGQNFENSISVKGKNFVFAGRLSPTKNLESLIYTVYYLQENHSLDVGLHLFGKFDNFYSADWGRWDIQDYEGKIKLLIDSLKWVKPPVFHGLVAQDEWVRAQIENSVYVNFSTFMSEDFDVSLAEAQQKNWPAILSAWGGHLDIHHPEAILVPWRQIGRSDETAEIIQLKSECLARYLAENEFQAVNFKSANISKPRPVSKERIDELRQGLIAKMGADSFLILKEGLARYADTSSGKKFFSLYRSIFGQAVSRSRILITNDLNPLNEKIRNITYDIAGADPKTVLVSQREALLPDNIEIISNAKELHLSIPDSKFHTLVRSLVPKDCLIQVYR